VSTSACDLKEQILGSLTPEQVYGEYVELRRSGKSLVGLCCFHSERTPSFTVSPKLRFKCWGCDKEGSAFDFVMEKKRTDFRGAMEYLAAKAGIPLHGFTSAAAPRAGSSAKENPNPAHCITVAQLALDKKISGDSLREFGVKDMEGGVQISYFLSVGSLAPRQIIRTALSAKNGSRWDNGDGSLVPYGLHRLEEARKAGFLCFVEGESDAWTLWHHGFPCLGIPGASMTGCVEANHVAGIPKVYIVHEPDKGGATFVSGLVNRFTEIGWNGQALVVSLAPFKDPNELHKSNPEVFPESFLALMDAAGPLNLKMVGVFGILASEVKPRTVQWLWRGRIPLGKITDFSGDPGLGKSATILDIAARITTGSSMPDGSVVASGGVLVLNAEDDEADTIVPRLTTMNADLTRVRILKTLPGEDGGHRQPEIPGDLAAIERAARSVDAKLIIIDPLMAFLSGATNSWKDQDVRRALAPLAGLAECLGVAIVIVRHLTKNSAEGNPLYRGGGSIGIIGAARSGLLAANDPDDPTGQSRLIASTKSNLGPLPPSLRYVIEPCGESIHVRWCGESEYRAAALLAVPADEEEVTAVEEAAGFLRAILEDGAVSAKEIFQRAKSEGLSEKTVRRAKTRLGLKKFHQGFGKESKWTWDLPAKMADPPFNDGQ
jgi:hypothetical protein